MYQEEKKLKRRKQIPPYSFAPGTDETKAKAEHCAQQTFARSRAFQNTKFKAKDWHGAIGNDTKQAYDTYRFL